MQYLIDTIFNGKKFHFSAYDIDSVMKCFDYWLVVNMYVCKLKKQYCF